MISPSGSLFVGLMSGTSLDGIDAVLVDFSATKPNLLTARTFPFAPALREALLALCLPGTEEIERLGRADGALARALADATLQLLQEAGVSPQQVVAIGSHGQTIRHRPQTAADGAPGFTLQIGDPNILAQLTGITTVADFRRRDMAAGGQGAPLVPAFHRAVFRGTRNRVVVNIGGMANITALPSNGVISGFDTGPGNVLLDAWVHRHRQLAFDRDGAWAASGVVHSALLTALLAEPFFAIAPPKSTGRELFNLPWLAQRLSQFPEVAAADVQATLAEFTARTITDAIVALPFSVNEVFVCGGGACNTDLMHRLERLLHPRALGHTGQLGIDPAWVEAAAFAWLARETLAGRPGNEPAVTGANNYCVLGAIHPA